MSMHRIADLNSNSHSKLSSCWSNSYVSATKHSSLNATNNRSGSSTSISSTSSEEASITDSDSASSSSTTSLEEENESRTSSAEENKPSTSYSDIDSTSSLSTISASTSPTQYTNSIHYFPNNAFIANKTILNGSINERTQDSDHIASDTVLKLLFASACIVACIGIGFLIFGIVKNEFIGYIIGSIVFLLGLTIFVIVMVLICKQKKEVDKVIIQMSRQFLDKKETTFERSYFNNSIYANRTAS